MELYRRNFIPIYLTLIMWLIFLLERVSGVDLGALGIQPRHWASLPCILTAPLIHGSWSHLLNNSFSFLILGLLFFNNYPKIANTAFVLIYLLTGTLVWIAARGHSYHIGISGIIYGMASFIFFNGFYRGNNTAISLSLLVAILYGSMIWGVLPYQEEISWESHLSGAGVGFLLAFIFRNIPAGDEEDGEKDEKIPDKKDFDDFLNQQN